MQKMLQGRRLINKEILTELALDSDSRKALGDFSFSIDSNDGLAVHFDDVPGTSTFNAGNKKKRLFTSLLNMVTVLHP